MAGRDLFAAEEAPKGRVLFEGDVDESIGNQALDAGKAALDKALWLTRPFAAASAFALAPIGHRYDSQDFLGQVGEAFNVAGKAAFEDLFPAPDSHRENFAGTILQDVEMPEQLRPTAEMALSVVTDPSIIISGGFAHSLRKSFELAARTGEVTSPYSTALKEFVSVVPMSPQETTHFTKMAQQADNGDVKATQELLDDLAKANDEAEQALKSRQAKEVADGNDVPVEQVPPPVHPMQAVEPNATIKDVENVARNMEIKNPETLRNAKDLEDLDQIKLKARVNVMRGIRKERSAEESKIMTSSKKRATETIDEHPAYQLIKRLKSHGGVNPDGLSPDIVKRLKGHGIIKKDGISIIDAASRHGFEDALSMFDSLSRIGKRKDAIKAVADDIFKFEVKGAKGLGDVDLQARFIDEEARLMGIKFNNKGIKKEIRKHTQHIPMGKMVTEEAALKAAWKKAEQASRVAFREGKKEGYSNLKVKFDAYREAVVARRAIEKSIKSIDRSVRHKSVPVDYMEQMQAILGGLRHIPKRARAQTPEMEFSDFLALKESEGDHVLAESLRVMADDLPVGRDIREMTASDIKKFEQFAKAMVNAGVIERKFLSLKTEMGITEKAMEAVNSIRSLLPAKFQPQTTKEITSSRARISEALESMTNTQQRYIATLMRPKFIAIALDGEKLDGVVTRLIERPLREANDREIVMLHQANEAIKKAFSPFEKNLKQWKSTPTTFDLSDGAWTITKERQIMIALNNGNSGNRDALMRGFNLTEDDVAKIVANLDEKELKLVDDIFEVAGSFWKDSSDIHLALTGQRLKQVDGKYFQIVQDFRTIEKSGGKATSKDLFDGTSERDLFSTIKMRRSSKTRGTQRKDRVGGAGAPLLKFDAIGRQVNNTIHDITHALPVRDVQKILGNKDFKEAVTDTMGQSVYNQLVTHLQHVARPTRDNMSVAERIVRTARSLTTVAILGANVSVGLKQTLSLSQTVKEIGFGRVAQEVVRHWTNPAEFNRTRTFVDGISPSIAARGRTLDREFVDLANTFVPKKYRDMWFAWIRFNDRAAVYPSYMAAYKKKIAETGDIEQARLFAEDIVEITQPINQAKDLPATMRGSEWERTFKSFMSFFSVAQNQFQRAARQRGQLKLSGASQGKIMKEAAQAYWWLLVIPSYMATSIDKGRPATVKETVNGMISFRVAGFPYARDLYSMAFGNFGSGINPTADTIKDVAEASGDPNAKNIATVVGFFTSTPVRPFIRFGEGMEDLYKGNTEFWPAPLIGDVEEKDEFEFLR